MTKSPGRRNKGSADKGFHSKPASRITMPMTTRVRFTGALYVLAGNRVPNGSQCFLTPDVPRERCGSYV
jgi:hypothetical protein